MADPKKKAKLAMRAEILSKVLDCIYVDNYEDFGEYLIFGGSLEDLEWEIEHPGQGDANDKIAKARGLTQALREAVVDIAVHRGRNSVRRRASLDGPAKESPTTIRGLGRLEDLGADGVADALRDALDAPKIPESASEKLEREMDECDASFAKEVLAKLPRIVRRISTLQNLDIQGIPGERVRKYFEEAHRCYLYGFPIACAILCRAIIESALGEVIRLHSSTGIGPRGDPEKRNGDSNLSCLIQQAESRRLLTSYGVVCANDVRKAGISAVHPDYDRETLERISEGEGIDEVLTKTRKVLQELYGQIEAS